MQTNVPLLATPAMLSLTAPAGAQFGPVDRGVVCVMDGTTTYEAAGPDVDDDYNYVDAFRDGTVPVDPLDGPPRPSAVTTIDAEVSGCTWIRGEELEACFPIGKTLRYVIEGATVSDTACASRTFKGTFRLVDEDGAPVATAGACTGDLHCGHASSEIAIDVLRVIPGISDPGSVSGEANDGRGESAPLSEQCTLELLTTRDGTTLEASRFGLASMHFLDGPEAMVAFATSCTGAGTPVSATFTGVVGSSSLAP